MHLSALRALELALVDAFVTDDIGTAGHMSKLLNDNIVFNQGSSTDTARLTAGLRAILSIHVCL